MNFRIFCAFLIGFAVGLTFLNLPPVLDAMMKLYGVSYAGIAVLLSALLWSHALAQVPGGIVVDRLGLRSSLICCMAFMGTGNLLPAFSPSLALATVGRVITGVGTGLAFVSVMKMVAVSVPSRKGGEYQAYFGTMVSLGSIVAFLVLPSLLAFGWRWAYLLPAAVSYLAMGLVFMVRIETQAGTKPAPLPLMRTFGTKAAWILGLYHALSFGTMLNLSNWIPSLLAELQGASSSLKLAWGGALVMTVSGLARFCGGLVLLRFTPLVIANGSILALFAIYLGMFVIHIPWVVLALALFAAWFTSVNFGALFHLAARATPSDSLATLFGFVNLLANLGAVLFTIMFGWCKDALGSFVWGFAVLSLLALAVALIGRKALAAVVWDH